MRSLLFVFFLAISFHGLAQVNLSGNDSVTAFHPEPPGGSIAGKISTTDDQPAAFVTVIVKGTGRMTTTDSYGIFTLMNVKEGNYILTVSTIGLKPVEKEVAVAGNQVTRVTLTLREDAKELDVVYVTAGKGLNSRPVSIGKMPVNPMDLPQSISVIGNGLIRDQQAMRLSDVVKNVNGVYLATTRGSSQESFSARGYSFGNNNLFKNGSRVNSGAMPEVSGLGRVEVLKGDRKSTRL